MAALVLRLRLSLLVGAFRGEPRQRTRAVAIAAGTAIITAALCVLITRLGGSDPSTVHALIVVGGALVVAGFVLAPLVTGTEDVLDPRRFAALGPEPRALAATLAGASLIGVSVWALIAVAVAVTSVWTSLGVPLPVAAGAAALGVVTCVLGVRVAQAVDALVVRPRRFPEMSTVLALVAGAVTIPALLFVAIQPWGGGVPPDVAEVVGILSVTPLGAAWAIPDATDPAGPVAVALVTVVVLGAAWLLLVQALLRSVDPPAPATSPGRWGWFAVTAATPAGAIAARSLLYWFRDPRYLANLAMVPVAAVCTALPLLAVGVTVPNAGLLAVAIAALLFGWLAHNDLAYDASALWMHVAAGVSGAADRIGRLVPLVTVAGPLLAVSIPLVVALHGSWDVLPAVIGACTSLFLCGLGLSSVTSVALPYVVASPGDGAFQQPQRSRGGMGPAVVLCGALILSAPTLALATDAIVHGGEVWPALWVGVGTGVGVLAAGIAVGAAVFAHRQGMLMEFAESMP